MIFRLACRAHALGNWELAEGVRRHGLSVLLRLWIVFFAWGGMFPFVPLEAQTNRYPHINIVSSNPTGQACTPANSLEQYNGDIYTCDPNTLTWRISGGNFTTIQGASGSFTFGGSGFQNCVTSGGSTLCTFTGAGGAPGGTTGSIQGNSGTGTFSGGPATINSSTGAVSASVNTQFNVSMYGAKGDCSHDDTAAFNSAQTAALAYTTGGNMSPPALYLPKPPAGCYIINDWVWKGIPLEGQPSGGVLVSYPLYGNVTLQSSPGHDIIRIPDPTLTSGTNTIAQAWSVRNVSFNVDNSVAPVVTVGGNPVNANRFPGRSFDDLGCTSGSNVITTIAGDVSPGDVGEPVQLNGCGPSGGNLVTTIASVSPSWVDPLVSWQKITIATNASTTVTNGHGYISVLNLPVTTTIGNCAIAQDLKDGNSANWIGNDSLGGWGKFENVTFSAINGASPSSPNYYPCAIFEQGTPWLYGVDARNIQVHGTYFGIAQVPTVLNSKYQPSSGDVESWVHGFFNANVTGWLSYNGLGQHLEDIQLTGYAGPQVLQDGNIWGDGADSWQISGMGFESPNGNDGFGWRLTGLQHNVSAAMTSGGSGQFAYFDANDSTCTCGMVNTTVNGYGNKITLLNFPQGFSAPGQNTQVLYNYDSSPPNEIPSNYRVTAVPYKGSNNIAGRFTPDWLVDGNTTVPYNHDDNFVWPTDLSFPPSYLTTYGFANYNSVIVPDSTSPTGYYVDMVPGIAFYSTSQQKAAGQSSFIVGTNLPDNGVRVTMSANCPSGPSTFTPFWGNTGASHVSQTFSCTTSYQTYSMSLSYVSGDIGVGQQFSNAGSGTFHVAWFDVQPYTTLNGLSAAGAGAGLTTGPNSGTSVGHVATFADTNGTIQDGGYAPAQSPGNMVVETGNYTLANGIPFVQMNCTGCTLTLPATPATGFSVAIMDKDTTGSVTISPNGVSYDGLTTIYPGQSLYVSYDGTSYHSTGNNNLAQYCGAASFSSSTTSGALSCAWVTSGSHCTATWIGSTVTGGALGFTASSGSVTLTAATSNSGSAAVYCSPN